MSLKKCMKKKFIEVKLIFHFHSFFFPFTFSLYSFFFFYKNFPRAKHSVKEEKNIKENDFFVFNYSVKNMKRKSNIIIIS